MSDWNAGKDAVTSIAAGNDMLQPGQERQYNAILEAVKNGTLDEALLNLSVKRVLEFVVKSHTFAGYNYPNRDRPQSPRASGPPGRCRGHRAAG